MTKGRLRLYNQNERVSGPGAGALKYDILTALLAMAAQAAPLKARLALRLSLLMTARFNWRAGTFVVAQKEMARMWGVSERTAKREIAALRELGWITIEVPAARGRIASHRIIIPAVLRSSMPYWDAVGPDYAARMTEAPEPVGQGAQNVVPFQPTPCDRSVAVFPDWPVVFDRLQAQDPSVHAAWFAALQPLALEAGKLTLLAPSRFIADYVRTHYKTRILATVVAECAFVTELIVIGDDPNREPDGVW